jgi:hypothetical protein
MVLCWIVGETASLMLGVEESAVCYREVERRDVVAAGKVKGGVANRQGVASGDSRTACCLFMDQHPRSRTSSILRLLVLT